jgi:hypothetical protein
VAQLGQGSRRHQAYITGSNHSDLAHAASSP